MPASGCATARRARRARSTLPSACRPFHLRRFIATSDEFGPSGLFLDDAVSVPVQGVVDLNEISGRTVADRILGRAHERILPLRMPVGIEIFLLGQNQ